MTTAVADPEVSFRTKFSQVMAGRKRYPAFVELFDKLTDSKVFAEADKPHCFGMLLDVTAERLSYDDLSMTLAAIRRNAAIGYARTACSEVEADRIAAKFVRKVFTITPRDRDLLDQSIQGLVRAGFGIDRGQVLGFACLAQMPEAQLDEICDLTYA